jgi:hypothetical protein
MRRIPQTFIVALVMTCLLALLVAGFPEAVTAQEAIQMIDQSWDADFRDHITFKLSAEGPAEIVEADLLYRIKGQLATSRNEAEFTPGTAIEAEFVYDQNDPSNYQPPGTELEYWWKAVDAEGNELTTERETLLYLDDRYSWQTLENERVTLYWYEGDDQFGQLLFERANEALDTLQTDIGISLEDPIKIFIYGDQRDLMGAIRAGSQEWTGGQAFTDYGVVVIGVHPAQLAWGLNAMTHEMTHLVIHQATDNPFSGLPRWLDEGIAVYNENRDELDVDFRGTFERAIQNDALMTLRTLSSPFPADPFAANLAYGQSGAVVKFIVDTFGSDKMAELLEVFAEGALYDEALEQVLGLNTDQLDTSFRASLGLPPLPGTEPVDLEALTQAQANEPAEQAEIEVVEETTSEEAGAAEAEVVVEAVPTSESPAPLESNELSAPAEEAAPTSEPAAEVVEQPASEAAESTTTTTPVGAIPCATGLIVLLIMGLMVYGRRS